MTPGEIAQGALIGGGIGLAARPFAARAGRSLGRVMDKADGASLYPDDLLRKVPGTRQNLTAMQQSGGVLGDIAEAKLNQNYLKPDGTMRGDMEGAMGLWGRVFGDNIAQGTFALASPYLIGNNNEVELV